jgi:integrase
LRINELLNLKKSNLSLNDKYITIKFFEQKKNDIREIIIVDAKAIKLVTQHLNLSKTDCIFSLYVNVFNNNLKALARLSGMTETVEYIKNYRTNTVTLKKPKWELISSHAIRRYAVNQNVVKHGIDIARQFSGHKDYATIKKNYMRNINQQELLERLKDAK